jgi:CheY-like chemotaxis protein
MSRPAILLVDASRPARYPLRLLLQEHGAEVRTADSAEQALALIRTAAPDAVFAARILPGMNGLELLEILKSDAATRALPIVICCPDGDWPLRDIALQRGAMAVLGRDQLQRQLPEIMRRIAMTPAPGAKAHPRRPQPSPARPDTPLPAAASSAAMAFAQETPAPQHGRRRFWNRHEHWRALRAMLRVPALPAGALAFSAVFAGIGLVLLTLLLAA